MIPTPAAEAEGTTVPKSTNEDKETKDAKGAKGAKDTKDTKNAKDLLGKTAYYNPNDNSITLWNAKKVAEQVIATGLINWLIKKAK